LIPLLLDTGALVLFAEGEDMTVEAAKALDQAAEEGALIFVSPVSGWEIGFLAASDRLTMSMDPAAWFDKLASMTGIGLAEISVRVLIASSTLPGSPPRDLVDRILVATARENGYRLVTRDKGLLTYAEQGHVPALAC
jgi:PIN domain nuclease of toxin-antitoxin system